MSSSTTTGLAVATLVDAANLVTYTCTGPCGRTNLPGQKMHVPDTTFLYRQVKETPVDTAYPLNRKDMEPFLECGPCAFDPVRRDKHTARGITRMFRLLDTLELMDRWIANNVTDMNRKRYEATQRERGRELLESRVHAPSSFVNETLAQLAKPAGPNKPRPKHRDRTHTNKSPRNPNAPKIYGEMRPVAKQNTSKKKGRQDDKDARKKKR